MTPNPSKIYENDTGNKAVAGDDFRHRFPELDGLRGIASFIVGLFHDFCLPLLITTTILGVPVVAAVAVDLHFIILPAAVLLTAASTLMSLVGGYWLYLMIEQPAVRLSRYLGMITHTPSPKTAPAA